MLKVFLSLLFVFCIQATSYAQPPTQPQHYEILGDNECINAAIKMMYGAGARYRGTNTHLGNTYIGVDVPNTTTMFHDYDYVEFCISGRPDPKADEFWRHAGDALILKRKGIAQQEKTREIEYQNFKTEFKRSIEQYFKKEIKRFTGLKSLGSKEHINILIKLIDVSKELPLTAGTFPLYYKLKDRPNPVLKNKEFIFTAKDEFKNFFSENHHSVFFESVESPAIFDEVHKKYIPKIEALIAKLKIEKKLTNSNFDLLQGYIRRANSDFKLPGACSIMSNKKK